MAENGAIAVELFRRNPYDVVLMDGEMPVKDGYTATREIRELESGRNIPILAFTAHAFADMAAKVAEDGFTDLLTKPVRRVELLEALARYGKSNGPRIRVVVEPDLRDLVPGYLEKRRAEVADFRREAAAGNLEGVRAMGHKIRGTGGGYGFPFLTEIGAKIELAARDGRADELKTLIDELAEYLAKLDIE